MIHFEWPWLFAALPLPLLVYWLPAKQKQVTAALHMPHLIASGNNMQAAGKNNAKVSLVLLCIIWMLLVFSATRPQWLAKRLISQHKAVK